MLEENINLFKQLYDLKDNYPIYIYIYNPKHPNNPTCDGDYSSLGSIRVIWVIGVIGVIRVIRAIRAIRVIRVIGRLTLK